MPTSELEEQKCISSIMFLLIQALVLTMMLIQCVQAKSKHAIIFESVLWIVDTEFCEPAHERPRRRVKK